MTRAAAFRAFTATIAAGALVLVGAACQPEGSQDVAALQVNVTGSTVFVAGWAWDQDVPTTPIDVHIYVHSSGMAVRADGYRPDVAAVKPAAGAYHGYSASINVAVGTHQVCSYAINAPGTAGDNVLLGCSTVTVTAPATTTTTAPTPTTTTPTTPSGPATWQDDLVALVNDARTGAGSGQLDRCAALDQAAQAYADQLAANRWLDPVGPDGSTVWTRTAAYGADSQAENLSWGYDTVSDFHASTVASASQSTNLLLPEFTAIGVGRAVGDPDGSGPLPSSTYWVEELGQGGTC